MKPSGIGGQAVIEGIMMKNKDMYSVAVRKPDDMLDGFLLSLFFTSHNVL